MKTPLLITFYILTLLCSCCSSTKKTQNEKTGSTTDDRQQDSSKTLTTIPENITPVLGYRFIVSGDFDGDGKKEKLIEHFFQDLTTKKQISSTRV